MAIIRIINPTVANIHQSSEVRRAKFSNQLSANNQAMGQATINPRLTQIKVSLNSKLNIELTVAPNIFLMLTSLNFLFTEIDINPSNPTHVMMTAMIEAILNNTESFLSER